MDDKQNDNIFDKFMDKIVKEEAIKKVRAENELEDAPSRVHQKRYKEHPHNRIVYRR
jgi:hypothetical protein